MGVLLDCSEPTDRALTVAPAASPPVTANPAPAGHGLSDARWLLLLNTLPVTTLLALLAGEYSVIHTLLDPEAVTEWRVLGSVLLGAGVLNAAYVIWLRWRGQPLTVGYSATTLALHIAALIIYCFHLDTLFPFSIPRWMMAGELPWYVPTFLMPTLAHAVAVAVVQLTPAGPPRSALGSFGWALAVPGGWYLLLQIVLPILHGVNSDFFGHALVVMGIGSALVFLFFLARGVYILTLQRTERGSRVQLVGRLTVAVVLPLVGLLVNNGGFGSSWGAGRGGGIFGDFGGPWFYGLALLNGALLCWPHPQAPRARLLLTLGRAATLPYTLYFFVVFLPFLPLSVVAVAALGIGFLLLTPLVLLIVHVRTLRQDMTDLRAWFSSQAIGLGVGLAGLVLPVGLTASCLSDRLTLHRALDYLYQPDYAATTRLNADALATTLTALRAHKERTDFSITGSRQPYLATYYNWLVLDNLTIADAKLDRLEKVFHGQPSDVRDRWRRRPTERPSTVGPALADARVRSTYDARQTAWVSAVDLTIDNATPGGSAEYVTTFALPAGCYVEQYYLDIAGRRELGILAERKAAEWVYSQITTIERRDPGLLRYLSGNRVELRVYPFAPHERRRTGLRIVHKEPLTLLLDGRAVTLGDAVVAPSVSKPITTPDGAVTYLGSAAKQALPLVRRRPYYHFLLDAAAGRQPAAYVERIHRTLAKLPLPAPARFTFVDAYATPADPTAPWETQLQQHPSGTGGCYLDGAIRQTLAQELLAPADTYPVLVVATENLDDAVLGEDFADLAAAYPETDVFYVLDADGRLTPHSLRTESARPLTAVPSPATILTVRVWPDATHPRAYLSHDDQPAVVLNEAAPTMPGAPQTGWLAGLRLAGYEQARAYQPAAAEPARLASIRASFQSGILTPQTAYLSLENEAQKAALRRKQTQMLNGHANLDAGEEDLEQPMPEPDMALLVVLAGVAGAGWRWRQRRVVRLGAAWRGLARFSAV